MKRKESLLKLGVIEALPNITINIYTNLYYNRFYARVIEFDNGIGHFKEIKTSSWRRFVKELQKEISGLSIIKSEKVSWFDSLVMWLCKNKNSEGKTLHEYILSFD